MKLQRITAKLGNINIDYPCLSDYTEYIDPRKCKTKFKSRRALHRIVKHYCIASNILFDNTSNFRYNYFLVGCLMSKDLNVFKFNKGEIYPINEYFLGTISFDSKKIDFTLINKLNLDNLYYLIIDNKPKIITITIESKYDLILLGYLYYTKFRKQIKLNSNIKLFKELTLLF